MPVETASIAAVEILPYRASVSDGTAMSFSRLDHRTSVIVEVHTDDGRIGVGESWVNFPTWAVDERIATLSHGVRPRLLGRSADEPGLPSRVLEELAPLARQWGAPGPIHQAVSAVDVALWDLRAQLAGVSICDLDAPRVRHRLDVYASSLGPHGVEEMSASLVGTGIRAVKLKVGFEPAVDIENLRTVRRVLGPDVALYVDANQGWTLEEAVAMAPVLRDADVAWVEEPVRGNHLSELEAFHARTGLPVATGENIYGRGEFARYVASPAIAVIQPDVTKAGGLTEALAVCRMAEEHGTDVVPHFYGGAIGYLATLQLAGCSTAVTAIEHDIRDNPLRDHVMEPLPVVHDGRVTIPTGNGLGARIVPERIQAFEMEL